MKIPISFIDQFIGLKIMTLRKVVDLTQDELADRIGLSRPSIVHIENGNQSLTVKNMYKLIYALDCKIGDLFPNKNDVEVENEFSG